jgi:hypothetical protein
VRPLTRAQRVALLSVYRRGGGRPGGSYLAFRRTAQREVCGDAIMVPWCGIWLGIESDGYTHS